MRYCIHCKKPMHTSIESIWIGEKSYDMHKKCKKEIEEGVTYCPKCRCMTKSIRKGRASYECGKCKADKSLSDYYQWELNKKEIKE